jgi:phage baseplate assembly protein W
MAIKYRGFSTIDRTKKFHLADIELVKRDLINHFSIRKGEKLMQPSFGSIIWNMLFEPMTADVQAAIVDDIKRIVNYDPRINATNILVNELDQGLQIQIDITYLQGDFSSQLTLNFNTDSSLTTS